MLFNSLKIKMIKMTFYDIKVAVYNDLAITMALAKAKKRL